MKHAEAKLANRRGYHVRISPRAKHVCIKVSHLGEVEVVVPKGFDQRKIPEIMQRRQDWIAKTMQRIEAERQSLWSEPTGTLPEIIVLRSIPEEWSVAYCPTTDPQTKLLVGRSHQLTLQGEINLEACIQGLQRWLSRKAILHLTPWLRQISQEINLPFSNASVRGQKTRWASCSSRKSISLNYKLLFLPPALVRYVLIHELCHTVHLNHSSKFWALVAEKEPNYKHIDKELRTAWRYVPEWVEHHRES